MIIEFKYRDSKNKQQTVTKNLESCLSVERVFIYGEKYWIERVFISGEKYWIERKELHV